MREGAVALRYAEALYELAKSQGAQADVLADLAGVKVRLDGMGDGWSTLLHPRLAASAKERVLGPALAGHHDLIAQTLRLLVENRRESVLIEFFRVYLDVHERREGIVRVVVETATPLEPNALEDIARRFAEELGREVRVEDRVEPSILRGMRLRVGSHVIDGSLRGKLDRLRARLLAVRVGS